jgi:hypothetical protein
MKGSYGILRQLKWDIWGAKFMAHLHKRYTEVKTMSETDKNVVPEVVGKTVYTKR